MPLLLVDDRNGRVVAKIETEEQATQVLEAWARGDGSIPEHLCLVEFHARHGAVLGADSSITVRPLW